MAQGGTSGSSGSAANVTHALKGIDFPCSKDELVKHAKNQSADDKVVDELKALPDQQYNSMAEVMKGFGASH